MDNRMVVIRSDEKSDFETGMKLIGKHKKAVGYRITNNKLTLYWADIPTITHLPYAMNAETYIVFAWNWLQSVSPLEHAPDHDGDNAKGFCISIGTEEFHANMYAELVTIEVIWAIYGK